MSFGLVKNAKSEDFPKGNCKIAWDRLVNKYASNTVSSLLKPKGEFNDSKLELIEKDSDEWISNFEGLKIRMNEFELKSIIADEDFINLILSNLLKEHDVILDRLENCLTVSGDDVLTIDVICKKIKPTEEKN